LHHAYLIEGASEKIVSEILEYVGSLGVKTSGNPDFCQISMDFLKIKQALDLREMATEKGFTGGKKIFIISANRISLDAQGVLLKMFEEPIENTHFFVITPDINVLTKTLLSRFYLIRLKTNLETELKKADKFIKMPLKNRIDFIKEFVAVPEDDDAEVVEKNSVRSKAFEFLNALEYALSEKVGPSLISEGPTFSEFDFFDQIFKAREFLRQPGSPTKTLLESVAIAIPTL
jgi:hypothetical protein